MIIRGLARSTRSLIGRRLTRRLFGFYQKLESDATVIRARLSEHRAARLADKKKPIEVAGDPKFPPRAAHLAASAIPKGDRWKRSSKRHSFPLSPTHARSRCAKSVSGEGGGVFTRNSASWFPPCPLGMGLAGACFRVGNGVLYLSQQRQPRQRRSRGLPAQPGPTPHAYLLALPIDHPDFTLEKCDEGEDRAKPAACRRAHHRFKLRGIRSSRHLRQTARRGI